MAGKSFSKVNILNEKFLFKLNFLVYIKEMAFFGDHGRTIYHLWQRFAPPVYNNIKSKTIKSQAKEPITLDWACQIKMKIFCFCQ